MRVSVAVSLSIYGVRNPGLYCACEHNLHCSVNLKFSLCITSKSESGKKKFACGIRNLGHWNQKYNSCKESRESHEQLETGVQVALTQKRNPRRAVQNSKTFLDSLTCGDKSHTEFLCLVHAAGLLASSCYFVGALLGAKAMTFM